MRMRVRVRMRWERDCSWLEIFHALHAFACQGQVTNNSRDIHNYFKLGTIQTALTYYLRMRIQDETHPA